ncbi:MAG: gmk, guanylate kinase, guanylate kinase [Candidatus Dadabacteria bacterium CSP1-2]|jgi:guanylate kinase|nr:MAG: gmk, guanylate kinase, guanylate kinase [Candidatus Dadabacteria bacterium CSP1-2]MBF8303474.1 Guanylate kinase [Candidatus Dadabacteria bacterium]
MREGIIFVVSGPSGSGKTTLTRRVIKMVENLSFSVSFTTRQQRPGEVDGIDYRFISENEFDEMVKSNRFAEWAQVHDHRYGTPVEEIDRIRTSGVDLLLDIDSQGAKSIRKRCDSGVYIFIIPPTFDVLKDRIMRREGERTDEVARRIEDSINEMEEIHSYDYIIINDSLDEAVNKLKAVIIAERCKRERVLK